MASKSIFISVAFLLLFCFILLNEASECKSGQNGCFAAEASGRHSRKVLVDLMEKKTGAFLMSGNYGDEDDQLNAWELRKVPSGPDPLHHNGNSPKKPRSP
ncbi:hypothetical protein TIFTF001_034881 [Ficus carica]|uniref:CLAVATA3/ESR-related protein n=1 Tax=Ficus carica TaxID=3494 RepID=A0AA88J9J7_FICCA|nr:hypothetical protein TIFTF001_034858 [Ficus carica]GMN65812.1 hypothetical protein TIFTF001_034881 [Ficus carica]